MTQEIRSELYNVISNKNALLNKYIKKIAEKAEISKNLSTHIARHSFAKIAVENKVESKVVKELLANSNLATTERYMGVFDTKKTDIALKNLFGSLESSNEPTQTNKNKKEEIIEMMKDLSPEEIAQIMKSMANQTPKNCNS